MNNLGGTFPQYLQATSWMFDRFPLLHTRRHHLHYTSTPGRLPLLPPPGRTGPPTLPTNLPAGFAFRFITLGTGHRADVWWTAVTFNNLSADIPHRPAYRPADNFALT